MFYSLCSRVPYSFLLIGGIIGGLSILGLLLIKEPKQAKTSDENCENYENQQTKAEVEELPSLNAKEVLRTSLFYKVNKQYG